MTQYIINNRWSVAAYIPLLLVLLVLIKVMIGSVTATALSANLQEVQTEVSNRDVGIEELRKESEALRVEVSILVRSPAYQEAVAKVSSLSDHEASEYTAPAEALMSSPP